MRNPTRALLVAAALSSAALAGCVTTTNQPSSSRPSAGEVVDDGVVTAKIKAKLIDDPITKAYQINVETFQGTVQLSGFVDSAQARTRASQLARETSGVKDVKNSLQLRESTG